jgi:hypothetical protein
MKKGTCSLCEKDTWVRRLQGVAFKALACSVCAFRYYNKGILRYRKLNQSGGASVGATLFLLFGFAMFIGAVFFYVKGEESSAKQAQAYASEALLATTVNQKAIDELKAEVKEGDQAVQTLVEIMLKNDEHGEKLKQKIEWLEMKANNTPRSSSTPSSLLLKQTEPIKIQVIYPTVNRKVSAKKKKAVRKKATPKKKKAPLKKKKVIKKKAKKVATRSQVRRLKHQMSELSH